MSRFIDVNPGDWFYNDIKEASELVLESGEQFISGIPYHKYEKGAPYVYVEKKAVNGVNVYSIPHEVVVSSANPFYVFIDGVGHAYKSVVYDKAKKVTNITLFTAPKGGSLLSFVSYGKPLLRDVGDKRPTTNYSQMAWPHAKLKYFNEYYLYYGSDRNRKEYLWYFGKPLKRARVTPEDVKMAGQELARKYIGFKDDTYVVTYDGRIHVPFNYEGMTGKIKYCRYDKGKLTMVTEDFKCFAGSETKVNDGYDVFRTDRFFPNALINRGEALAFMNRLKRHLHDRFTDVDSPNRILNQVITSYTGQRVFRLNGTYPSKKGVLNVYKYINNDVSKPIKLTYKKDYQEFDDHTVVLTVPVDELVKVGFYYAKNKSDALGLVDVGEIMQYFTSEGKYVDVSARGYIAEDVLDLENLTLNNGDRIFWGRYVEYFQDSAKTKPKVDTLLRPIQYKNGNNTKPYFMPATPLLKLEGAAWVNRLRKWFLERINR